MKIKPASDKRRPGQVLRVLDPETGEPLSPEGEDKPDSVYWLRRLKCGDVLKVTAAKKVKKSDADLLQ